MPLSPLDSVAVNAAGRSVEVALAGAPFFCGVWGLGSCSPPSSEEVGGASVLLGGGWHVHVDPISPSWPLLFGDPAFGLQAS